MVYDVAVVGGGIIGLATTRELLRRNPFLRVANIEKEQRHGVHQSGHNSGVVHSGVYYRPGSLRARMCVEGRRALLRYCAERDIRHKITGKVIVAVRDDELGRLQDLYARGVANGTEGIELVDARRLNEIEPHCRGLAAVWCPGTAIVDFRQVARAFAADALSLGADLFLGRRITAIERRGAITSLHSSLGDLHARFVVTCGGLYADRLARMAGGLPEPRILPFRGQYLTLSRQRAHLVRGNIYPVPDPALPFLGVHFTPRIDGSVWLGPNAVLALSREGYARTSVRVRDALETLTYRGLFALARRHWRTALSELTRDLAPALVLEELRRYVPDLTGADIRPGPSGVRAQAMTPGGTLLDDIVLDRTDGALHLRNAASPGATSCLAIARYIAEAATKGGLHGKLC